jgi:hypothetical protein
VTPSLISSQQLSNAYYSLSLLSSSPAIQSILYRVLDVYCHKDLFSYPSKNAHITSHKEKYREWNEKLRETILNFERVKEEERRGSGGGTGSLSATTAASSSSSSALISFPPSHLLHCLPEDECSRLILQRDEIRREVVYSLKDVLVPEKKFEAQRKFDYLERVIGLMKEWYSLTGGGPTSSTTVAPPVASSSPVASKAVQQKQQQQTMRRQSSSASYSSPTSALSPLSPTAISSLNVIPSYEEETGGIKPSTTPTSTPPRVTSQHSSSALDDNKESHLSHQVPPIRDVFHALELFIQNLSVWYTVASQSPIQETNTALARYESCLQQYLHSLGKFSTLQRAVSLHDPLTGEGRNSERHLTDVTLEDHEEDQGGGGRGGDQILSDPSLLLENTCAAVHALHTALDHEEYFWTRDPIATLYPSLHTDLQRILDYLTTLSLDLKKSLLEGFSSLKEKEKELQQVVVWIAGSPSYELSVETLEGEVRFLKREIIRLQRDYEDKIHELEKQKRKYGGGSRGGGGGGGGSVVSTVNDDVRVVERELLSSQVAYQYKTDQLNTLRKELCQLCYQTFPEIAMTNSSFLNLSPALPSSSGHGAALGLGLTPSSSSSSLTSPYPYPSIFSLPLLLSTHLNSSFHLLYQHAPLLSHGRIHYHRALDDYLNLTLVSSSERYLTYKALDKNKEVYIKKYHITSSSSSTPSGGASSTGSGGGQAVVSVTEQSFSQFEKLYLEALRLSEMTHSQHLPSSSQHASPRHPSLIDVESLFISSPSSPTPSIFLVFPSYPNGNMVQFLASYDAQLSLLSRVSLMHGLCSALSHLHDTLHLLHCNLKLENVFLSSSYRPLLSDYDISYLTDTSRYTSTVHTPSKGFLDYLPPENLPPNSLPMSMASDVYCFGICLLKVLGKPLCRNRENGLHTVGYYDREDGKNGFKELVERILSLDPKQRPTTSDILRSSFYSKWIEHCGGGGEGGGGIEEGSISWSDREEIEKLKREQHQGEHGEGGDGEEKEEDVSDEASVQFSSSSSVTAPNSSNKKQHHTPPQPSGSAVQQVYLDRQRLCITCGLQTDLSQGLLCGCSSSSTPQHFLCLNCLNQYVHSECSVDIMSRRWMRIFDKTTKEEFHVRRSAEHILPYFTTKKRCHVEGLEEILEKNPWSDLHEFNHEFDVRELYEDDKRMMRIICPAYHIPTTTTSDDVSATRCHSGHQQRCENLLDEAQFMKLLSPQVLCEYERSGMELLEWKLTWEYSFRVTEERRGLLVQVKEMREKELRAEEEKNRISSGGEESEKEEEAERVPEYVGMIQRYIEREIDCVKCPRCACFVGNGRRLKAEKEEEAEDGARQQTPVNLNPDAMPLLSTSDSLPFPPPPPPPRHPPLTHSSSSLGGSTTTTSAATGSRNQRQLAPTTPAASHSHQTILSCPSCSNYFCSICLTDCGGLPSRPKPKPISSKPSSDDLTTPLSLIASAPEPYSGNEEMEMMKRKKFFHPLTCPYNSLGRVWLTADEFYRLQEERIVSMTSDFLQTFPEEIREEFLEHTAAAAFVPVDATEEGPGEHRRHGMREIEI